MTFTHSSTFYQLKGEIKRQKTHFTMNVPSIYINTAVFPNTHFILMNHAPSVLKTECFNYQNLPFVEEVKETEMGHLFEHILLDYLCKEKIRSGALEADYCGRTSWNWKKDLRGTFHVELNVGENEQLFFFKSLENACQIMELIFNSNSLLRS